jgi:primosomal protein N' (replication factor Y) (superfamily II helicase)
MTDAHRFAEIAVNLPVAGTYHYEIPARLHASTVIGARVQVRFGARKVTGVVVAVSAAPATDKKILMIEEIIDPDQPTQPDLVALAMWLADYYEAPPGEALRCVMPAGATSDASVPVVASATGREALINAALPPRQRDLLAQLCQGPVTVKSLGAADRKVLASFRERQWAIDVEVTLRSRTNARTERVARLTFDADIAVAAATRAPAKLKVIEMLRSGPVACSIMRTAGASTTALRDLEKMGHVVVDKINVALRALPSAPSQGSVIPELTDEQQVAVSSIVDASRVGFAGFLLFGITGSGKTEVYLRVIADVLADGKTAIVLVPEISLTPQLAARFRDRFGDRVAVLHSGLSARDRHDEWQRLHRGQADIAVGARSAVFAPMRNLGVIIVDEEHDGSFKQEEGVRYHARDVALVRAQRNQAVCVLGSATPSLESYWQSEKGAYRRLVLSKRPTANTLPSVEIVDLTVHRPDGEAMLSARLRSAVTQCLADGDQCVLFLNRRGFATFVLCKACGFSFRCAHCSVSMTYHRERDQLVCHYCGATGRVPSQCPSCKSHDTIERRGLGTERVAAAVMEQFPNARVARLDRDTASGHKLEETLRAVHERRVDILVGTQMVSKGHDFPGVTLVGVLCADTGLTLPDFRAAERTYQLLSQVAGRAGRGAKAGQVLIQTYRARALAITAAANHDYIGFYQGEVEARAELGYPPHGRLIAIRIDGPDARVVVDTAQRLAQLAVAVGKRIGGVDVAGPVAAPLEKLRGRVRWQIWLRGPRRQDVRQAARSVLGAEVAASVRVSLDVDPVSTM